jgi:glutamine amidotransferase
MCRLVAYSGPNLLLEEVLVKPINSIVMQSLHARESTVPTNGDGFGLGWYAPHISPEPALFTSISPAWNDRNLLNLTAKIESPLFFAHVRAASAGGVTQYNCHPFVYGQWMLMHNGGIHNFLSIKRHLRRLLDDDIYDWIKGETDSEHLFALFLQLAKGHDLSQLSVVADVLQATFDEIARLLAQFNLQGESHYNICLTDGHRMLACRYCSNLNSTPESMHYAMGSRFGLKNNHYHMLQEKGQTNCILISSERLTDAKDDWQPVPANHMMLVDSDFSFQFRSL